MPLGPGVRYRYKPGTDVRLAFRGDKVVEAKNTKTGKTHTQAEFSEAARRQRERAAARKALKES